MVSLLLDEYVDKVVVLVYNLVCQLTVLPYALHSKVHINDNHVPHYELNIKIIYHKKRKFRNMYLIVLYCI